MNKPTQEQKKLLDELKLPSKGIQRFNIRQLISNPKYQSLKRYLGACQLITIQAREEIDVSFNDAYELQK
jgi:hypothetical protein